MNTAMSGSPPKPLSRIQVSTRWGTTKLVCMNLGVLLAWCGGPLLISDLTRPVLQWPLPFVLTFAPFVPIVFGAWSLYAWENDSWDRFCLYAGFVGLAAVVGMDLYAAYFFLSGGVYAEPGLIKFGMCIGALVTFVYVWLALRWLREEWVPLE